MNSLIIGDTSQLSYYFPKEYERISSNYIRENLPLPLRDEYYDRVYITFAEQRLHEITNVNAYIEVNAYKTIRLVNSLRNRANTVIVYGSCELWNDYCGAIDLSFPFKYSLESPYSGYCISKEILVNYVHELNADNVFVLHPFNFNSPYRKNIFLFSKIFDSLINKKKIEIGDTYFYRDIIHPKYVVKKSIEATSDELIGSGRLIFVNGFIRDLYCAMDMKYEDYVTENFNLGIKQKSLLFLKCNDILYSYHDLLNDTIEDVKQHILNNGNS